MNTRRLGRRLAPWVACSIAQALVVVFVSSALDGVQAQLKVAPTDLAFVAAGILDALHTLLSWPFRLLLLFELPEAVFVGAAVTHFALWGAVWLGAWRFMQRVRTRKAHEG